MKNFHNFVLESDNSMEVITTDIRYLFSTYSDNAQLVCNDLNRKLRGKDVRLSEFVYDEKKNLFKWKRINDKFLRFESVEKIADKFYINFDKDCFFELVPKLLIESRLIIFDK